MLVSPPNMDMTLADRRNPAIVCRQLIAAVGGQSPSVMRTLQPLSPFVFARQNMSESAEQENMLIDIMHSLVLLSITQHTKSEVPLFTDSKDITRPPNLKMDHVTLTMPIRDSLSSQG